MGKSVTTLIKSGMKEVRDDLKSQAKSLGKFCLDVQSMQTKCNDIQSLLEIAGEQPPDLNVVNKESAPPASNAMLNEGKELVVYNSEEKKSEGIISVEDDSDEDDKKPTPPKDSSKGKAIVIIEEPGNELGPLSQEEYNNQIREMKRLNDLKAEQEKSEHELRNLFNPATLKDQAQKWTKHKAKEETRKITRGNNPLNLIVCPNFKLKTLGFSEWLEAKRLGLPPPPELVTFGLTAKEKKRKRTGLIKEVFVTENVRVDGIDRNLIPPPGIMPIQGLVINEQESGIFFMNGNTDIGFQREKIRPSIEEPLSARPEVKKDQLSAKHQLAVKGLSEC
ncbi:hypothetical protein Tco_1149165 [Tanacetum coccineum]